jgi:hypothetical protein
MVRQPFDLGGETIRPESFDRLDDAGMQPSPLPQQETSIGHFVGQRMRECVASVVRGLATNA